MLSDQQLFRGLKNGDMKSIETIYQTMRPKVKQMILSNNGGEDDANDIFQETLEIILLKIEKIDSSFSGLVMRIAKNRWIDKLRKSNKYGRVSLNERDNISTTQEDEVLGEQYDKFILMDQTFEQLGQLCKDLIVLIKKELPTNEIVEQLAFNSANTMYRRKAACIEKWSSLVKEHKAYKSVIR